MSDTDKKDNETNIESKVPGEQEVRGVSASGTNALQAEGKSETDYHYEPIITVTKQEASFTKGDLKLQKISVTEDISDETKNETIINEVQITTDKNGSREVTHTQTIETKKKLENTTPARDAEKHQDDKKQRTKIPMYKLRRAIKKITEERKKYEEAEREKMSVQQRKSSIPRLQHTVVAATETKTGTRTVSPRTDEEFDKLFEEIIINQSADDSPLIKDPEKLEFKFEELIHAYDENKIEPISIERVKSRIPLLKRKSEHEIDVAKHSERRRSLNKRGSIDSSTHKTSTFTHVEESKMRSKTIQRKERTTTTQETVKHLTEVKTTKQQSPNKVVTNSQDSQEKTTSSGTIIEATSIEQLSVNNDEMKDGNERASDEQFTSTENSEDTNESVNSPNRNNNAKLFAKSYSIDNSSTTNFENEDSCTQTKHKIIQRTVSEQYATSVTSTNISSNTSLSTDISTAEITNNTNESTTEVIISVESEGVASKSTMTSSESDKTINNSESTLHIANEDSSQSSVSSNIQNSIETQKGSNEIELVNEDGKCRQSDENANESAAVPEIVNDSEGPNDKSDESDTILVKEISETNVEGVNCESNIEKITTDNNIVSINTKEVDEETSKQDSTVTDSEGIQVDNSESVNSAISEEIKIIINQQDISEERESSIHVEKSNPDLNDTSDKDTTEISPNETHVSINKSVSIDKDNITSNEANSDISSAQIDSLEENTTDPVPKDHTPAPNINLQTEDCQIGNVESYNLREHETKTSVESSNKSNYLDVPVSMIKETITQHELDDKTHSYIEKQQPDNIEDNNAIKKIETSETETTTSSEYNVSIDNVQVQYKEKSESQEACLNNNEITENVDIIRQNSQQTTESEKEYTTNRVTQNVQDILLENLDDTLAPSIEDSLTSKINVDHNIFVQKEETHVIEKTISMEESVPSENLTEHSTSSQANITQNVNTISHSDESKDPNESVNVTNTNENAKVLKKSSSIDNSSTTNFENEASCTQTKHMTIQRTVSEQHASSVTSTYISSNTSLSTETSTAEITNNNNESTTEVIISVESEGIASEITMTSSESDKAINNSKSTLPIANESIQTSISSNIQNSIEIQKEANKIELADEDGKYSQPDENANVPAAVSEILKDNEGPNDKSDESDTILVKEICETNVEEMNCESNIQEIATDNNIVSINTKEVDENVVDEETSKQDSTVTDSEDIQVDNSELITSAIKEEIKIIINQQDISDEKESTAHVEYNKKIIINEESNTVSKDTSDKDATEISSNEIYESIYKSSSINKDNIANNEEYSDKSCSQIDSLEENITDPAPEDRPEININLQTEDSQNRNGHITITSVDSSNKSNYLDRSVSMVKEVIMQHKLDDKTHSYIEQQQSGNIMENYAIKRMETSEIEITTSEYNVSKDNVQVKDELKSERPGLSINTNQITENVDIIRENSQQTTESEKEYTTNQVTQNVQDILLENSDDTLAPSIEDSLSSKINVDHNIFVQKEETHVIEKTISREESITSENKIIDSISETKSQFVFEVDEKPQKQNNQLNDKDNTTLIEQNTSSQANIAQNVNIVSSESSSVNDSIIKKESVFKTNEQETKTTLTTQSIFEKKVTESQTITRKLKEVFERTDDTYEDLNIIKRESKGFESDKITIDKTSIRPSTPVIDISPSCIDGKEKEIIISSNNVSHKDIKTDHYFKEDAYYTRDNNTSNITDSNGNKDRTDKVVLDKSMINELLKSDLQEEDIIILRGKVSRVMSRLDSINSKKSSIQQEIVDEVPKRTVLSKIAIFERKELEEKPLYKRTPRTQSHGSSFTHKPKIVKELLKTTSKMETNVNTNRTEYNKQHYNNISDNLNNNQKSEDAVNNKLNSAKNHVHFENNVNTSDIFTAINNATNLSSLNSKNNERIDSRKTIKASRKPEDIKREVSYAEVDLGDAVKGKVLNVVKMISMERMDLENKGIIDIKEKPKRGTVLEKIALFEKKATPVKVEVRSRPKDQPKSVTEENMSEEELRLKVEELKGAKRKYGRYTDLKYVELNDGSKMPAIGLGTALLSKNLTKHIVSAAIDLGYRTIDTAYIYGNEKEIGEAINEKIRDGTVQREDLFIISKLWSTFHRKDLVEKACKMSLKTMGLDYFDLYMIHNPMSFKEGDDPVPKIANVVQYSDSDYLDAWYGVERVVRRGLARRGGVSNFNSAQVDRIIDKGELRPCVNQVECHPYLTQHRLDEFCQTRDVKLNCYGVLGSKGTPIEYKSGLTPVIDDPMVLVMAAGLNVTPAQLLISYQLHVGHSVIVKSSTAGRLWSNLLAQDLRLEASHVEALNALNRNKRNFIFKGMGDTHRNYPFRIPF